MIHPSAALTIQTSAPYDLTRGGTLYNYFGHTDVKELALYVEDQIKARNWLFNLGIRGDLYNGLAIARQAEPRLGVPTPSTRPIPCSASRTRAHWKRPSMKTSSSPARAAETTSSRRCSSAPPESPPSSNPAYRNEFHAGLQQAFGRHLVFSGDYIWKYTHNAFDFSVLGNTPITFPIDWHNSKIPGFALRVDVPTVHNFSAFVVMSSVAARFFPPQTAGAGATVAQGSLYPFRIDHDEKYNQTTHIQYQLPGKRAPWVGFNWRYDSGLVAGSTPCYNVIGLNTLCAATSISINGQPGVDVSGLTPDQQFQAGLACNGVKATPYVGIPNGQCLASQYTSNLLSIPAPNTEDDDKNPPRVAPRNVFDASIGIDNLFAGDKHKWSLRLTAVNVTNKYALYNFLSTFSGTHYLTPRALNAELGFHF